MFDAIVNNAYWLVFAGTVGEGETALLLGSLAASQGYVNLLWIIIAGFAGATTGDQISYQVLLRIGPRLIKRNQALAERTQKARGMLAGHPVKFIIFSRYLWGLRTASMLALATADVPSRVFIPANLLACALWAVIYGTLGYVFSSWVTDIVAALHKAGGVMPAILGGIAILAAVVLLARYLMRRFIG